MEISFNKVSKSYSGFSILKDITFHINKGEKIGVVGRNGCGKTTLFKLITGAENVSSGEIFISKGLKVGYLDQIPEYDCTVKEVLFQAFKGLLELEENISELERKMSSYQDDMNKIMERYGVLQEKFSLLGGYEIESRMNKICSGLKIKEEWFKREFKQLSGGEKSRVVLGKILLENPDILLLDEPSNHLDFLSIQWLENYLLQYKGTILIISHDRYLLDKVVNKIINIDRGVSYIYHGNYSFYVKEKKHLMEIQESQYQNYQKKVKSMEDAIRRFRHWGAISDNEMMFKKAKNMEKRLERLEKVDKPNEGKKMNLNFSKTGKIGNDVFLIENVSRSFGPLILFNNLNLHVRSGEHSILVGKNGSGKSTLFKALLGEKIIDSGQITVSPSAKIGYLKQEINYDNPNLSVLEQFRLNTNFTEGEARYILARFMFQKDTVFKKVSSLSGGEKSRLEICKLIYTPANVLLLDEPTNHLDIEAREVLEEALMEYKGTLFIISHDRYFINKIADYILELENKRISRFEGDYDYYFQKKQELNNTSINQNGESSRKINKKPIANNKKTIDRQKLISNKILEIEEKITYVDKQIDEELKHESPDYENIRKLVNEKDSLEGEYLDLIEEQENTMNPL